MLSSSYENNSTDFTVPLLTYWASVNDRVNLVSEIIPAEELAPARTMRIANARNNVIQIAKDPKYSDYKYLIMADLDFKHTWPILEIVKTIESEIEWDCVSANGIYPNGDYLDRYAFRDKTFTFGTGIGCARNSGKMFLVSPISLPRKIGSLSSLLLEAWLFIKQNA